MSSHSERKTDVSTSVTKVDENFIFWEFMYALIGIASLIAATFAGLPNLTESLRNLLIFAVSVTVGLTIHGFVALPLIYLVIVRKNPYRYVRNLITALLLAFGSESRGVTLPVTIRCLEKKNGVDSRVTRLVASLGATINMGGIALYFAMMALFIAQLSGITLNAGQIVTVWTRTVVNILGDCFGAAIVEALSADEIQPPITAPPPDDGCVGDNV